MTRETGVQSQVTSYQRLWKWYLIPSWRQHPTRRQLYGHLPPITKTIQVRRTRHAGHCWRSRDELIRDVLLWTPTHGRAKAGRPARTYIQQLCEDTGCCPEDLPRAMNDREEWRERVRDIRATSMTWWWWSRVKWINLGKGVASPTPRCSSYWKRSLWVILDYGRQHYFFLLFFVRLWNNKKSKINSVRYGAVISKVSTLINSDERSAIECMLRLFLWLNTFRKKKSF